MVPVLNENESSATSHSNEECHTLGNESRKIVHNVHGKLQRGTIRYCLLG